MTLDLDNLKSTRTPSDPRHDPSLFIPVRCGADLEAFCPFYKLDYLLMSGCCLGSGWR